MISLEQVKLLEEKVESLISVVKSLYGERNALKETVAQREGRIEELEAVIRSFEVAQAKIEESVMSTLNQLDVFESSVANNTDSSSANPQETIQSEEFSFSDSSVSSQMNEHSSDLTNTTTHQDSEVEKQKTEADDFNGQMDIF